MKSGSDLCFLRKVEVIISGELCNTFPELSRFYQHFTETIVTRSFFSL